MNRDFLGRVFRFCFLTLFIVFVVLYLSLSAGYVEYKNRKQTALTDSQIKKFEADVASGKQIDLEDYLKTNDRNYENNISKFGLRVSSSLETGVEKVVDISFKFLSKLSE